ncbi:plastocyanin/azurin family copper-binding protein [uncultured Enterovirga sp.]|uniref:cupredoxin domain-containing protein n=1 Tax=uncultured Enterovirga sp. TaxID=2026352 RepID=UPI0035CA3E0A
MIALSLRGCAFAAALAIVAYAPALLFAEGAPDKTISQKGRAFAPGEVAVQQGGTIRFTNDDPFLHQIFVSSAKFSFDSNEQSSGQSIDVKFPTEGDFQVLCGIHPKMSLKVRVR